jgi:hypothetical protein
MLLLSYIFLDFSFLAFFPLPLLLFYHDLSAYLWDFQTVFTKVGESIRKALENP